MKVETPAYQRFQKPLALNQHLESKLNCTSTVAISERIYQIVFF